MIVLSLLMMVIVIPILVIWFVVCDRRENPPEKKGNQTRIQSILETAMNYAVGFSLAWLMNKYVLGWMGFKVSGTQATGLTFLFTAVSVVRSYVIRRIFNRIHAGPKMRRI